VRRRHVFRTAEGTLIASRVTDVVTSEAADARSRIEVRARDAAALTRAVSAASRSP
jgi:hypothetical protein